MLTAHLTIFLSAHSLGVRQNNKQKTGGSHDDPRETVGNYETGWGCCHCDIGKGWDRSTVNLTPGIATSEYHRTDDCSFLQVTCIRQKVNIAHNPDVLITLGSSKVKGLHGAGAGFLIKGKGTFITSGPDFDFMKAKYSWLRATLAITIDSATQTW